MDSQPNHYRTLGLRFGESRRDEIRRAYRHKAKMHHPSSTHRHVTRDPEKFKAVKAAHDILLDDLLRAAHNKELIDRGDTHFEAEAHVNDNASGSGEQGEQGGDSGGGDQSSGSAGSGETGGTGETSGSTDTTAGEKKSDSGTKEGKVGASASGNINPAPYPKTERKENTTEGKDRDDPLSVLEERSYSFFQFVFPGKYRDLREMHVIYAPRRGMHRRPRHRLHHATFG